MSNYNQSAPVQIQELARIKLKPQTISQFDGDPLKWPYFKAEITNLVLNNSYVPTNDDKFRRIYQCLPEAAKLRLATIDPLQPDLDQVMTKLDRMYGQPGVLFAAIFNKVNTLPHLRMNASLEDLEQHFNVVSTILASQRDGLTQYQLLGAFIRKMDPSHSREAFRGQNHTFEALSSYLEETIATQRISQMYTTHCTKNFEGQSNVITNLIHQSPTERLKTTMKLPTTNPGLRPTKPAPLPCLFCQENHRSHECTANLDNQTRFNYVVAIGRCVRCFSKRHNALNCPKKFTCQHCHGPHATVVCLDQGQLETKDNYHGATMYCLVAEFPNETGPQLDQDTPVVREEQSNPEPGPQLDQSTTRVENKTRYTKNPSTDLTITTDPSMDPPTPSVTTDQTMKTPDTTNDPPTDLNITYGPTTDPNSPNDPLTDLTTSSANTEPTTTNTPDMDNTGPIETHKAQLEWPYTLTPTEQALPTESLTVPSQVHKPSVTNSERTRKRRVHNTRYQPYGNITDYTTPDNFVRRSFGLINNDQQHPPRIHTTLPIPFNRKTRKKHKTQH